MSHRLVLGHRRTRLRVLMGPYLATRDPAKLARTIGIREHTARYLIDGRLRAGLNCARGIAKARGVSVAALLG